VDSKMETATLPEDILLTEGASTNGEGGQSNIFILIMLTPLLMVSLLLSAMAPKYLSRPYLGLCIAMAMAVFVIQCISKWTLPKPVNWFSVDILFPVAFFLVHFWYTFSWLVGLSPSSIWIWKDPSIVCYAAMMSLSGLIAFLIGYNSLSERFSCVQRLAFIDRESLKKWKGYGITMFIGGVISVFIYIITVGPELFQGTYRGTHLGGYLGRYLYLLLNVLLNVSFVVMTISAAQMAGKWKIGIITKIAILFFLTHMMVLGDRSTASAYVVVLGAAYSEYIKPVSFKKFVLVIIVAIFVMSVGLVGRGSAERTVTSFVKHTLEQKEEVSLKGGALNVGTSLRCLHEAVSIVPSEYNYFYGKLKVNEILSAIPFAQRAIGIRRLEFMSSAYFLTWAIYYGSFSVGAGSTIIADIYLDFGYPGVIIVMFLLGLLAKYLQQKARGSGTMVSGVAYCCLVSVYAILPRYSVGSLLRGILWPVLMLLLVQAALRIPKQPAQSQESVYDMEYGFTSNMRSR
jgi:oligosaccharide repeat unit polymerase